MNCCNNITKISSELKIVLFSGNRAVEAELDRALDSKQKALIELEERKAAMAELEEKEARWREEAMRRQEEVQVNKNLKGWRKHKEEKEI